MLGFLFAALHVLSGFGSLTVKEFELAAAKEIQTQLSPPGRINIQTKLNGVVDGPFGDLKLVTIKASEFGTQGLPLFVDPHLSKRGNLRNLRIELADFRLRNIRVEQLVAEIPNCRYDYGLATRKKIFRLSKSGEGTGSVKIREQDLAEFVLSKFPEVKRVEIRIDRDKVFVKGYGEFIMLSTNFEVIAKLESPDGRKLFLNHAKIFFDGVLTDGPAAKAVLKALNPVVDLDTDLRLSGAMDVKEVILKDGLLEAKGVVRIPPRNMKPN